MRDKHKVYNKCNLYVTSVTRGLNDTIYFGNYTRVNLTQLRKSKIGKQESNCQSRETANQYDQPRNSIENMDQN